MSIEHQSGSVGRMSLLVEQFVVLSLELLDDVLIVEQFLDGAVGLAEQVFD